MILAAIDVGTNSVKLQVARLVDDRIVKVLEDRSVVTRLGRGVSETRRIRPEAAEATLKVLHDYRALAARRGAEKVFAVGTEALRVAGNAAEFRRRFELELGVPLKVISGAEEARLSFFGATAGREEDSLGAIDIGGGSTELMHGTPGRLSIAKSAPIGVVVLTERFLKSDPPAPKELAALRRAARGALSELPSKLLDRIAQEPTMLGIGGTCANLGSIYSSRKDPRPRTIHNLHLSIEVVERLLDRLAGLKLADRRRVEGLSPDRADVILAGAAILLEAMELLKMPTFTVSLNGIRRGLLLEAAKL